MKTWNKLLTKLVLIFSSIILIIGISLFLYNRNLNHNLSLYAYDTLSEISEQQKFNFNSEISSEINDIKLLATSFNNPTISKSDFWTLSQKFIDKTKFEHLALTDLNGVGMTNTGDSVDISNRDYFSKVLASKTVLSPPVKSSFREAIVIPIATPIYNENKIVGVLIGSYKKEQLDTLLLPSYNGKGYAFIVDRFGNIITSSKNDYVLTDEENLFASWETAKFSKGNDLVAINKNMQDGKTGRTSYKIDSNIRLAHYSPLAYNDWYIFVIVPNQVISSAADNITTQAILLTALVVILFIFCIIYISILQIREQKNLLSYTTQLEEVAYYDKLTHCPNLFKFKKEISNIISENQKENYYIIKIDISNFKMINDIFSMNIGDKIIIACGNTLEKIVNAYKCTDCRYARINADEFILFFREKIYPNDFPQLFEHEFKALTHELLGSHRVEFRYGRYLISPQNTDLEEIIENVNLAHKIAKAKKMRLMCDYDDNMKQSALRQVLLQNKMEDALKNEEFKLYLQPKFDLYSEKIVGAEALVRWEQSTDNLIYPNEFIPLFEENGFITDLDFYMLEKACKVLHKLETLSSPIKISVNFSKIHLYNPDFVEEVCRVVDENNVARKYIEIEITESIMFNNESKMIDMVDKLSLAGFGLSMDDFGSGYSSLGLLKNIAIDTLKMDRSFLLDNIDEEKARIIIESVLNMAKKINVDTVAEGVETEHQVALLKTLGCDIAQGFFYAKPMSEDDFINFFLK